MLKHCHVSPDNYAKKISFKNHNVSSHNGSFISDNISQNLSIYSSSANSTYEGYGTLDSRYGSMDTYTGSQNGSFVSIYDSCGTINRKRRDSMKIYLKCLRPDMEYKTLCMDHQMTVKDIIKILLSKFKMRHRDPKLFYITMDFLIKLDGNLINKSITLEDDAKPVELKNCHPFGECKFSLKMKHGGLVRIYDSVLMAESKYKALLISEETTVSEVILLLFHCYGLENTEHLDEYCIVERSHEGTLYERKLLPYDRPVQIQSEWLDSNHFSLVLRRKGDLLNFLAPTSPGSANSICSSLDSEPMETSSSSVSSESSLMLTSPTNKFYTLPKPRHINQHLISKIPINQNCHIYSSPQMYKQSLNTLTDNRISVVKTHPSIHESGLPQPILHPRKKRLPDQFYLPSIISNEVLKTFRNDYENYFYI